MPENKHDLNNTPRRLTRKFSEPDNVNTEESPDNSTDLSELENMLQDVQKTEEQEPDDNVWSLMDEEAPPDINKKTSSSGQSIFNMLDDGIKLKPEYLEEEAAVKPPLKKSRPIFSVLLILLAAFVSVCITVTVFLLRSTRNDDLWLRLEQVPYRTATILYYTDPVSGQSVEYLKVPCNQNKIYTPPEDIPQYLLDAFVSIEDRKFYDHKGVDVKRTFFAFLNEMAHKATGKYIGGDSGRKQGASTINQQLVKNLTRDEEDTDMAGYLRKIKEIYRAVSMDIHYSKEDILYSYVNTISFTGNTAGVGAEAQKLFGKNVNQLTLAECAGLAGITRNPSRFNPVKNPDDYTERRNYVLQCMLDEEFITKEEYDIAVAEPLNLIYNGEPSVKYETTDYFTDLVIESLVTELNESRGLERADVINLYYNGGLRIHTTMDPNLQSSMERLAEGGGVFKSPNQAAMVSLDYTGAVKGIVGGAGKKEVSLGFNRAVDAKRQVGSTMKAIGPYAVALDENKITWSSTFSDSPVEYIKDESGEEKPWPRNWNNKYSEADITVREAVAKSVNTVAVKVGNTVGEKQVYNFVEGKLGITSLVKEDIAPGPMFLGSSTYGISPVEMAKAYSIFGNGGKIPEKYYCINKITDGTNVLLYEDDTKTKKVLNDETAYIINRLLKEVLDNGTASGMSVSGSMESVGKTGTTNDYKDFWFVGLTPYYVTAVWYGHDDNLTIDLESGNRPPVTAWRTVMAEAQASLPHKDFEKPAGVVQAEYCTASGLAPGQNCPKATGWYKVLNQPKPTCDGNH